MERKISLIGFGEAGRAFAAGHAPALRLSAYDLKRADMAAAFAEAQVEDAETPERALNGAEAVLSLVTADAALRAAQACAPHLAPGALWLDMNSVAPATKRAAAQAIEAAGGRYVDVAVMAPVHPARRAVPLLASGPHAEAAIALLAAMGFTHVRRIAGEVGAASSVKMIRSVMVKGLEALTAECMLAAEAAGVRAEVLASLDASDRPRPWAERADYNLDRMLVHGARRAAEMAEVVETLTALGISPMMSEGTVNWQQAMGELGITPPDGLDAKLAAIQARRGELGA